ncbi:ATP-dependent DNA ligase [Streptomyces coeruleorubidus]|uniref:ATP-dependent DNA ligase n=1 Tax=Streptomyces coeruleorubidus TaxID=116188 RepID=A0ABZ0KPQ4_STRC4|nr:ATP-dependent DNA ligase [Streptomyces coeruleorubidus]WOT39562.1 ATP-dependent DNA ligase [Streptomyces coeruleorubidus]
MGWLPCSARRVRGRAGAAAFTARHGHDGLVPRDRAAALAQLPADTGIDGELVVWERDRLAFERLQQRLARRGAAAAQAAREWPAHFVAFDLVQRGGDLTVWPYARRRAALEELFADHGLTAPWVLCPSTTAPALAEEWLTWTAAGVEGLCFKRLEDSYRGGVRSWRKYKVRVTTEAVIGEVTGPLTAPRTLLLGRYDPAGRLQYVAAALHQVRFIGIVRVVAGAGERLAADRDAGCGTVSTSSCSAPLSGRWRNRLRRRAPGAASALSPSRRRGGERRSRKQPNRRYGERDRAQSLAGARSRLVVQVSGPQGQHEETGSAGAEPWPAPPGACRVKR